METPVEACSDADVQIARMLIEPPSSWFTSKFRIAGAGLVLCGKAND